MLSIILGNWINLVSSLLFQFSLATLMGTSSSVSILIYLISISTFFGSVVSNTLQSEIFPRLFFKKKIMRNSIRTMARITLVSSLLMVPILGFIGIIKGRIGLANVDGFDLLICYFFSVLQLLCSQIMMISLGVGTKFLSAASPAIPSIVAVLSLSNSHSVRSILFFLTLGSVLQFMFVYFNCRKSIVIDKSEAGHRFGRNFALTFSQYFLLGIVNLVQKASLGNGSESGIAVYNYAEKIATTAQTLTIGGISQSSYVDWGTEDARHENIGAARTLRFHLELVLFLGGVVSFLGIALSLPVCEILFVRGSFTQLDAVSVAKVMSILFLNIFGIGVSSIWSNFFYSRGKSRAVSIFGLVQALVSILFCVILPFARKPYGMSIGFTVITLSFLLIKFGHATKITSSEVKVIFFIEGLKIFGISVLLILELLLFPRISWAFEILYAMAFFLFLSSICLDIESIKRLVFLPIFSGSKKDK